VEGGESPETPPGWRADHSASGRGHRLDAAAFIFLHVTALEDPSTADGRQASPDVDTGVGYGPLVS